MDIVITYVNGLDPVWQSAYEQTTKKPALAKRYRDWGLLPYLFRGIERNLPFVQNIHLVVSSITQVPSWVDTNKVHVVLHEDILPKTLLPTFNSTTIEMFLHRIEGLNERFLYFNDDMFPIAPMLESNFFQGDKIVMRFAKHWLACNMYKKQVRQADRLARQAAGSTATCRFVRPQHTCTPMFRSQNEQLMEQMGNEILPLLTPLRENKNCNQYFFPDYNFYTNRVCKPTISTKHCSMAVYSPKRIARHILQPTYPLICINDVELSEKKAQQMHDTLHAAFNQLFPEKSRWEK